MKKILLLTATLACFLLIGCDSADVLEACMPTEPSVVIPLTVRAASVEMALNNTFDSKDVGAMVFTGYDILWFNDVTKELRFKDNFSFRQTILKTDALSFFVEDEYVFSSLVYASSKGEQLLNNLVLYYNQVENKYFLLDGYPTHYIPLPEITYNPNITTDFDKYQELPQYDKDQRAENAKLIATGWEKFISTLKKEGLLK